LWKNDIDLGQFRNFRYRVTLNRRLLPEEYERQVKLTQEYFSSGKTKAEFVAMKKDEINFRQLTEIILHLNYKSQLDKMMQEGDDFKIDNKVKFIEVPEKIIPKKLEEKEKEIENPIEIIKPKNDIEINITHGIKVTISPNVSSSQIIKLIELLKEI